MAPNAAVSSSAAPSAGAGQNAPRAQRRGRSLQKAGAPCGRSWLGQASNLPASPSVARSKVGDDAPAVEVGFMRHASAVTVGMVQSRAVPDSPERGATRRLGVCQVRLRVSLHTSPSL
eukprot:3257241-Pyramimonas_sp.AAC.1